MRLLGHCNFTVNLRTRYLLKKIYAYSQKKGTKLSLIWLLFACWKLLTKNNNKKTQNISSGWVTHKSVICEGGRILFLKLSYFPVWLWLVSLTSSPQYSLWKEHQLKRCNYELVNLGIWSRVSVQREFQQQRSENCAENHLLLTDLLWNAQGVSDLLFIQ